MQKESENTNNLERYQVIEKLFENHIIKVYIGIDSYTNKVRDNIGKSDHFKIREC